jgi:hypothetical protein
MNKQLILVPILHGLIFIVLLALGLYVLFEHKVLISGKLTGDIYELDYPAYLLVSFAFFIAALVSIFVLFKNQRFKKINEWLLIVALIAFCLGVFI